jgi:Queuosine biosynthesis protein QueC
MTTRINFAQPLGGKPLIERLNVDVNNSQYTLSNYLPDLERDFLDIAMSVYVADRVTLRSPEHPGSWVTAINGREFELFVPVRCPLIWDQESVRRALTAVLDFMTGDLWHFNFVERPPENHHQEFLFPRRIERPFVGLFSGGLDSYAGVVNHIIGSQFKTGVLVAGHSTNTLFGRQRKLINETNEQLLQHGKHLLQMPLRHNLEERSKQYLGSDKQDEKSQRSRGFLFLALGLAIARMIGVDTLHVYENGFGALNLPQTRAGLGIDYTRAMNPIAFEMMMNFASAVFDKPMRIENPSMWRTKGQMCQELHTNGFSGIAMQTISCDKYPRQGKTRDKEQCGLCTSCLLRRISLAAASLVTPDQEHAHYEDDVYQILPTPNNRQKLFPLGAMRVQADRLRNALYSTDQHKALVREFTELQRIRVTLARLENRPLDDVTRDLAQLFSSYLGEWDLFDFLLPKPAQMTEEGAYGFQ